MNVLHVAPAFYPALVYGGPMRSIYDLCRALADAGDTVRVLATDANGAERVAARQLRVLGAAPAPRPEGAPQRVVTPAGAGRDVSRHGCERSGRHPDDPGRRADRNGAERRRCLRVRDAARRQRRVAAPYGV